MRQVWKARDTRLDRAVAVKVSTAEFSERLAREARAIAALNHPKICTLHDFSLSQRAPGRGLRPVNIGDLCVSLFHSRSPHRSIARDFVTGVLPQIGRIQLGVTGLHSKPRHHSE